LFFVLTFVIVLGNSDLSIRSSEDAKNNLHETTSSIYAQPSYIVSALPWIASQG